MTFSITYFSALDCAIRRKGHEVTPITQSLIAPSTWNASQVAEAFLRNHPGTEVLSCTPQS